MRRCWRTKGKSEDYAQGYTAGWKDRHTFEAWLLFWLPLILGFMLGWGVRL